MNCIPSSAPGLRAIDAANILKPALARGELQTIGATTIDEYRKHIEKDAALERRFQPIMVGEPTVEETIEILKGLRDRYEAHHRVKISDEALVAAAKLSSRYISDRFCRIKPLIWLMKPLPGSGWKCIRLLPGQGTGSQAGKIRNEKEAAVNSQEFETAAKLRDEEQKIKSQLEQLKKDWNDKRGKEEAVVGEENIAAIVSSWTGIPVARLEEKETDRLLKLEEILHQRVIGQEERSCPGQGCAPGQSRAEGSETPHWFLYFPAPQGGQRIGPALAEALFGDEDAAIRLICPSIWKNTRFPGWWAPAGLWVTRRPGS